MDKVYTALCLDTSLTATGYAVVRLPFRDRPDGTIEDPIVSFGDAPLCGQVTLKDARVSVNDRIAQLCDRLGEIVSVAKVGGYPIDFVAAEVPQHTHEKEGRAKSMHSIMAQQRAFGGVALWLGHRLGLPFVEVSPNDAKFCVTGNRNASKKTIAWMVTVKLTGKTPQDTPLPTKVYTEAVFDALSVACWCDVQLQQRRYGAETPLDAALMQGVAR